MTQNLALDILASKMIEWMINEDGHVSEFYATLSLDELKELLFDCKKHGDKFTVGLINSELAKRIRDRNT